MALHIRSLVIDPPVLMAPMAGVTDSPYRRVLRAAGCPAVVSEMISSEGLIRRGAGSLALMEHAEEERPIIAQIFGARPAAMAEAARMVADRGFDGLDINMGCPVPKVVRHGAGAALMRDPGRAAAVAAAVRAATDLPLSVKIRAGWSDEQKNALEVARALQGAGVDALCIHPRTRSQHYNGRADWTLIARLVDALAIPVIGNGDLKQPADGRRMMAETGCAAVMVGRAAMGDPWLPAAMAGAPYPPPPQERIKAFCTHLGFMVAWLGSEARAVQRMRKHLVWYSRGLRGVTGLRRKLGQFETAEQMRAAFSRLVEASRLETDEQKHPAQERSTAS